MGAPSSRACSWGRKVCLGIASPLVRLDAAEGGGGGALLPVFFVKTGEVTEFGVYVPRIRFEAGFVGGLGEALVPGADVLADVAACDPALEVLSDRVGDLLSLALDGVISDAAVGVDDEGLGDRVGRTGINTAATATAVVGMGLVGGEGQVGDEFAEEDPGAVVAGDEVAIFGDPAQARSLGPELVLDGAGIGVEAGVDGFGEASFGSISFRSISFCSFCCRGI